jgi:hypothetical protein
MSTTYSRTRAQGRFRKKSSGACAHIRLIDIKFSAASLRTMFQKKLARPNRCGINEQIAPFTSVPIRNRGTSSGISEIGDSITRIIARSWKTSFQRLRTFLRRSSIKNDVAVRNGISRQHQRLSKNRNVRNRWTNPFLTPLSSKAALLFLPTSRTQLNWSSRLTKNLRSRKHFLAPTPRNGDRLCWRSYTASTTTTFGNCGLLLPIDEPSDRDGFSPSNVTHKGMLRDTRRGWWYKDLGNNLDLTTMRHILRSSELTTSEYSSQLEHIFAITASLSGMSIFTMLSKTGEQTSTSISDNRLVLRIPSIRITSSFFSSHSMA